ncbi:MAG: hypothetical protein GX455_15110 [Phycisphaerae bacterium]|nr:hypothetical protein [Phycisphaerae bacterium]
MESIDQTIAAVCTATPVEGTVARSIVRISGPQAFTIVGALCRLKESIAGRGITHTTLAMNGMSIDAMIYAFPAPHSYTGQDVAEIHLQVPLVIVHMILGQILRRCRQARPGEFTLRAYLSGRMDLTQAEAVAQIVAAGNRLQVEAARRMLAGRLSETLNSCREELLNLLGQIEAGLDFSTEDISPISMEQIVEHITVVQSRIECILDDSIQDQELIDLPSVGLAGLPNAGKSSLMNALLGRPRSLVSPTAETTRDVLEAEWILPHGRCILFDCAGLLNEHRPDDILATMAQRAAEEALRSATMVLFCVDGSKSDWKGDLERFRRISHAEMLVVLTQQDRWQQSAEQVVIRARRVFSRPCLVTSAKTGHGLDEVQNRVDEISLRWHWDSEGSDQLALTQRHRRSIQDALMALREARREILDKQDEVAAMLLRSAIEQLGRADSDRVDEQVLDRIFSRFCIGK